MITPDRDPVDKNTAMLLTTKGEQHAESKVPDHQYCEANPPPAMLQGRQKAQWLADRNIDDLTGHTWGRMTVVGLIIRPGCDPLQQSGVLDGKIRWVSRCNCGNYMLLTGKAVRKKAMPQCLVCTANKIPVAQQKVSRPLAAYETPVLLAELVQRGALPPKTVALKQVSAWLHTLAEMMTK